MLGRRLNYRREEEEDDDQTSGCTQEQGVFFRPNPHPLSPGRLSHTQLVCVPVGEGPPLTFTSVSFPPALTTKSLLPQCHFPIITAAFQSQVLHYHVTLQPGVKRTIKISEWGRIIPLLCFFDVDRSVKPNCHMNGAPRQMTKARLQGHLTPELRVGLEYKPESADTLLQCREWLLLVSLLNL